MGKPTTTTKPIIPSFIQNSVQGTMGQIDALDSVSPQDRVAGSNPFLDAAGSRILGGINPEITKMLQGAGGAASVGATKGSDYYKDYYNPFEKDVIDTSLADYDVGAGRQSAEGDLKMAGAQAFGGSGSALFQSLLREGLARGRGSLSAGIRSQGFNTAMEHGSNDANRFLQAGIANAGFQDAAAGRKLQAAGLLGNLENQLTGQQMQFGDYTRGMERESKNADINYLGQKVGLINGLPIESFIGQKQKQSGGALGAIGSGLLGAASLFAAPMTGGLSLGGIGSMFGAGAAAAGAGSMFGGSNLLGSLLKQGGGV